MSGPSDKAVEAATVIEGDDVPLGRYVTRKKLEAAHDPALGLGRSVCLRDIIGWLNERENDRNAACLDWAAVARKIEQKFASGYGERG